MRTVYGSLPFYDSLEKQDVERTKAIIPIHCPRTQLPPFLIALGSESVVTVTSVKLVSNQADTYPVTGWTNFQGSYETYSSTVSSISAIETGIEGIIKSNYFPCIKGRVITVSFSLNITSGQAPTISFYRIGLGPVSSQLAVAGSNTITFTADVDASQYYFIIENSAAANWQATSIVVTHESEIDITSFFVDIPEIYTPTDTNYDPYIKYNGDTLKYLLPLGLYYVKIANGEIEYYSDWIMIQNIYPEIVTSITNSDFDTFTVSGTTISSAINLAGTATSGSNTFSVRKGEVINITTRVTINSGGPVIFILWSSADSGVYVADAVAVSGLVNITLTATWTGTAYLVFYVGVAINFSTTEILITRTYSPHFIKIAFKNSKNFGDLIYEDSFEQKVWLDAILNDPSHETVSVGEEKDGVFIAEKLISKLIFSVIAYVSQGLYKCLSRLPLHDTITITDEVGNTYTPDVGNVIVEQPEWPGIETSKLIIKFNDGEYSAFTWTK